MTLASTESEFKPISGPVLRTPVPADRRLEAGGEPRDAVTIQHIGPPRQGVEPFHVGMWSAGPDWSPGATPQGGFTCRLSVIAGQNPSGCPKRTIVELSTQDHESTTDALVNKTTCPTRAEPLICRDA